MLRAELDAYYAHLYGLTRDELRYILDPQDVYGPDFPGETFRVLKKKKSENSANTAHGGGTGCMGPFIRIMEMSGLLTDSRAGVTYGRDHRETDRQSGFCRERRSYRMETYNVTQKISDISNLLTQERDSIIRDRYQERRCERSPIWICRQSARLHEHSDIDFLVEMDPSKSLLERSELNLHLEYHRGRKVQY